MPTKIKSFFPSALLKNEESAVSIWPKSGDSNHPKRACPPSKPMSLKMLSAGTLSKPIDIFDLLMHGTPVTLLLIKLVRQSRQGKSQ